MSGRLRAWISISPSLNDRINGKKRDAACLATTVVGSIFRTLSRQLQPIDLISLAHRHQTLLSPSVSAARAPRWPIGRVGLSVKSLRVCFSDCALITAPSRTTSDDI